MSHAVDPSELATAARPYGATPFLLYGGEDGSARVNHVVVKTFTADPVSVAITGFGRGVVRRVSQDAPLSLLWPAFEAGGFSLIADGTGTIDEEANELRFVVASAVLHRPAPLDGERAC